MADEHLLDAELADLDRRLRALDPADLETYDPPASVWDAIERSLDGDPQQHADDDGSATTGVVPAPVPIASATRRRRPRAGRSTSWILGLAAASVLAVAGAVVVVEQSSGTDTIASAELSHQDGFDQLGASSSATAEVTDDGSIVLADTDLPGDIGDADLELWLIEPAADGSVAGIVSLGTIEGDTFSIPDGYDTERFSVVDISIEPRDGDATHSGRSILRGSLDA